MKDLQTEAENQIQDPVPEEFSNAIINEISAEFLRYYPHIAIGLTGAVMTGAILIGTLKVGEVLNHGNHL